MKLYNKGESPLQVSVAGKVVTWKSGEFLDIASEDFAVKLLEYPFIVKAETIPGFVEAAPKAPKASSKVEEPKESEEPKTSKSK